MTTTLAAQTDGSLERSQSFCDQITRLHARNFHYGLKLLPPAKRAGMYALYAWMRVADDLADDSADQPVPSRIATLEAFRRNTHEAINSHCMPPNDFWPGWPAMIHCAESFNLDTHLLDAMIDGQLGDISFTQPRNFSQLHDYCYRVASVVGLASIKIWGYTGDKKTEALAVDRGIAFQLTNILRDIKEDAARGRYYLPAEDMQRFSVAPDEILSTRHRPQTGALLRFEIDRARNYFERSAGLEDCIASDSRASLWAMTAIYSGILRKISLRPLRVLDGRVRLGRLKKTWIAFQAYRFSPRS